MQCLPYSVYLSVDRPSLGPKRAALVYQMIRYAARHLDPASWMQAEYKNHERVGYTVWLSSESAMKSLRRCHLAALAGLPLGPLLGAMP